MLFRSKPIQSLELKKERLEKKEKELSEMKDTYMKGLEEKSKQTSVLSGAPIFGTTEKAHEEAYKKLQKKATSEAEQKAREKKKGEEFKGAKEVEKNLEKAIGGDTSVDIVKELQKLNTNQLKYMKQDHFKHDSVAPHLSVAQFKEVSKGISQGTVNKMEDLIKTVAKDENHPAQANAEKLAKYINGPNKN